MFVFIVFILNTEIQQMSKKERVKAVISTLALLKVARKWSKYKKEINFIYIFSSSNVFFLCLEFVEKQHSYHISYKLYYQHEIAKIECFCYSAKLNFQCKTLLIYHSFRKMIAEMHF